jgi:hypothetical protein
VPHHEQLGPDSEATDADRCQLCGRWVPDITIYHLIPRTRHSNKRNKRLFSRAEVLQRIIRVCRPCHKNIHAALDNKSLERHYNTLQALAAHPAVARFSAWIARQRPGRQGRVHGGKRR